MRKIEVIDGVHVRFPARDGEFDVGVEMGALATLMALGTPTFKRTVSADCLEQLRPLAERFRYKVIACSVDGGFDVTVSRASIKPSLRLVSN